MTQIRPDLRALIVRARKDSDRWGKPKGLSQAELASKAGTSQVWIRQIETGYTETAKADTLGNICFVLGIGAGTLHSLGYSDIADSVNAQNHLNGGAEEHLRATPGLSTYEKEQLVEALLDIRRQEPYGREIWRRR